MSRGPASSEEAVIGSDGNETSEVNLHSVGSISDIHWASTHLEVPKGAEGHHHSHPSTPRLPHNHVSVSTKALPQEQVDMPFSGSLVTDLLRGRCPFCEPTFFRGVLYVLLASLVLVSMALMAYTVFLSVQHNNNIRALSEQLASQEESVRQMRLASLQLWQRLNTSHLGHT